MNIRELECFLAVADHGSITKAASTLYLAQPSLSQIIRRLENDLGVDLFRRVGRGLVMTPAGEALVGPARQVIRDVHRARQVATGHQGPETGRLDLAISASLTSNFLAAWVGAFRRAHPKVTVRLTQHDGDVEEVAALLRNGAAELVYTVTPVSRRGLDCTLVGSGELFLAIPPSWHDDMPDPVPTTMLDGLPMIVDRSFGRDYLNDLHDREGIEPKVVVDVTESSALGPLLLSGAGAAVMPMRQALEARARGARLRMLEPLSSRAIYAVQPSGPMSALASAFFELSLDNLARWKAAVEARMGTGRTLLEAAIDANEAIERAYRNLCEDPH